MINKFWVLTMMSLLMFFSCKEEKNDIKNYKNQPFEHQKISVYDTNFKRVDFNTFIGHSVETLLYSIKETHKESFAFDEPPGRLAGWRVIFPNNVMFYIYIGQSDSINNELDYEKRSDLKLFSKEMIINLEVKQNYHNIFGPIPSPNVEELEEVWDPQKKAYVPKYPDKYNKYGK